jgi:hypothetical protein
MVSFHAQRLVPEVSGHRLCGGHDSQLSHEEQLVVFRGGSKKTEKSLAIGSFVIYAK